MITRRRLLTTGGLAVAALGLSSCSGDARPADAEELHGATALLDLPHESTPGVDVAALSTADLGWELLRTGTEPNRVLAPSSLAITLGMLAEGATDDTLAALDTVLGLAGDDRSAALGALRQSLGDHDQLPESVDADDPPSVPVVHQASQVVVLGEHHVEQAFLDRLSEYFGAGAHRVPRTRAQAVLDGWAREHTAGLIEKSAIDVSPDLALVLQDAILLAAAWKREFTSEDVELEFAGPDGPQTVDALSGMFTTPHVRTDAWQAVRLHYDDALAMDVIVPREGTAPESLDADVLEETRTALNDADPVSVSVVMPPSDLTVSWRLLEALAEQGVTFEHTLDKIFPGARVDQFAQQVRLTVTAKGTVGAALTEVSIPVSAPGPEEPARFRADRPFIMRVLDTRTGWPLFLAVVSDAAAARRA